MKGGRPLPKAFCYATPALLVIVACLQLYRAQTQHLTPWKGGGFGMFSSADIPPWRTLRIYLDTGDGEALALYTSLPVQDTRVLNMPDTRTLEHIAWQAANTKWKVFSTEEVLDDVLQMPADLRTFLARSGVVQRYRSRLDSLAADSSRAVPSGDDANPLFYVKEIAFAQSPSANVDSPKLEAVRVEVLRLRYDREGRHAYSELLNSVTLDLR